MKNINRDVKGSMTIEMSLVIPIILFIIVTSIFALFYYHDKNILSGAAYETAVVGSNKARELGKVKEGELEQLFQERAGGKCIFFQTPSANVQIGKDEVTIVVQAAKGKMKLLVIKRARITEPERFIRDIRRVI